MKLTNAWYQRIEIYIITFENFISLFSMNEISFYFMNIMA